MGTRESNRIIIFWLGGRKGGGGEGVEKICSEVCSCLVTPPSKHLVGLSGGSYNMQLFNLNVLSFAF